MNKELQRAKTGITVVSTENWQKNWELIPVTAGSSPTEVLSLGTPQLNQLGKGQSGKMAGIAIFQAQIKGLVLFLGADWHPDQIKECGDLAYQECHWFTLAELKQFIVKIKTGHFRSHKNFSPAVFMEFLQEYSDEMHSSRGQYFGQARPIRKIVVLPVSKLSGRSKKVASWLIENKIVLWTIGPDPVIPADNRKVTAAIESMLQVSRDLVNKQQEEDHANYKAKVEQHQARMKQIILQTEAAKELIATGLTEEETITVLLKQSE